MGTVATLIIVTFTRVVTEVYVITMKFCTNDFTGSKTLYLTSLNIVASLKTSLFLKEWLTFRVCMAGRQDWFYEITGWPIMLNHRDANSKYSLCDVPVQHTFVAWKTSNFSLHPVKEKEEKISKMLNFCTKTRLACCYMTNHVSNSSVFRFSASFSIQSSYFFLVWITEIVSSVLTSLHHDIVQIMCCLVTYVTLCVGRLKEWGLSAITSRNKNGVTGRGTLIFPSVDTYGRCKYFFCSCGSGRRRGTTTYRYNSC